MSATAAPAVDRQAHTRRRRHAQPPVSRRSAVQLLVGVLIVGAIPIISTVRILQANAVRSAQAHADATLRVELQSGLRELSRLGDSAAARADDVARSPAVQRAVVSHDVSTLGRFASAHPGVAFYLRTRLVGGRAARNSLSRSVWLTIDGRRVARIVSSVPLAPALARRLTRDAPRGLSDRLVLTRHGRVIGGRKLVTDGRTFTLGATAFRGLPGLVPDSGGVRLVALRPEAAIDRQVRPYVERIRYAGFGSFALLIIVAFLFAGPVLRVLGDFRRVASQAAVDSLTGLANRRTLDEELALEWRRAHRVGGSLAFVLLDLDDFKAVNDGHGHPTGDAVLRAVGEILGAGVRQVDLAGRYGGEEFALILPETDLPGALKLAERIRARLEATAVELSSGEPLHTTASFGVAVNDELTAPDELVAAADEALYAAKAAGKNCVRPRLTDTRGGAVRKPERRRPWKPTAAEGEI
jgi:diguanylate cyclase (GGDEF)-like protein